MIKAKRAARNLSNVFAQLAIAGEYMKALNENPGADRKETLRLIKKKALEHRRAQKRKTNSKDLLTNNDPVMKRIIQQTKELIALIDEEVKSREKFFKTHEARWQDSAKGREYLEETEILNEMLNVLNDSICGLKNK